MMANFDKAFKVVSDNEGGFANHKEDKGGATMHGVSSHLLESELLRQYKDKLDINGDNKISAEEISQLSNEDAKIIFKLFFWDPNLYEKIWAQSLANQVFDFCINAGAYRANTTLQDVCNKFNDLNRRSSLAIDGIIGRRTLYCVNSNANNDLFVESYKDARKTYYSKLADKNPSQRKFLQGWLNRVDKC